MPLLMVSGMCLPLAGACQPRSLNDRKGVKNDRIKCIHAHPISRVCILHKALRRTILSPCQILHIQFLRCAQIHQIH